MKAKHTLYAHEYDQAARSRFEGYYTVAGADECWNWHGPTFGHGDYGQFYAAHKKCYAHRVAYALAHGECPNTVVICHTCDNTSCVNPAHLYAGTQADNMRDRQERGRSIIFEAQFTDEQVRSIRNEHSMGASQRVLAQKYGVSQPAIHGIVNYRSYKDSDVTRPKLWRQLTLDAVA